MHNMHISTLFPHNGVLQRGRHNGRRTTGKMMQTAKCPFAKNRHAQKYVLRKSGFPKDVFAKILDIQDRGLRKIRVRSFSKDVPCLYVILKYIHNVCICDVAILYMMTGNHLFFAKNLFSQKCWPQVAQIDRKMAAG